LTPRNILLLDEDSECIAKVVGFNHSRAFDNLQPVDLKLISFIHSSPEMLKDQYNEKTDMWSLGIIVYELLVGKPPYNGKNNQEVLKEVYNAEVDLNNQNFNELSFNAQDFIKKLLQTDPILRLSAKEALGHPWVSLGTKENAINSEAMMRLRNFKVFDK
jgi:calcium-dependent protein kinase